MIDRWDRVEFADVEVIGHRGLLLKCRVGKKRVRVPLLRMLPGTTAGAGYGRRGQSSKMLISSCSIAIAGRRGQATRYEAGRPRERSPYR